MTLIAVVGYNRNNVDNHNDIDDEIHNGNGNNDGSGNGQ